MRRWGPPAVLSLLLLTFGFPALRRYNVTWDEALGDFFFGQRFWSYLTTLDPVYLDFRSQPYPPGHVPDLSSSELRHAPHHHYFVGGTLAAAASALLHDRLGLLDPFDGYHAVNLLLSVPLLFLWYRFLLRRFGFVAATTAPLLFFLSPRVVCDLMANVKDFPATVFFSLALIAFLRAYEAGSFTGVVATGVLWGIALGARTNALFIAPIIGLLLLTGGLPPGWGRFHRALLAIVLAGCLGAVVWIAVWPYTWEDPPARLWQHLVFLATRGETTGPESIAPPLPNILYTTPVPFLVLFLLGLWPTLRRVLHRDRAALLIVIWILVVGGRLFLPGAVNYDGVRHFLELFPAMAMAAALGASWCVDLVAGPPRPIRHAASGTGHSARAIRRSAPAPPVRSAPGLLLLALPIVSMAWTLGTVHPFEICYWNVLIGGLEGAQRRGMAQSSDYWGTSYRLGLEWLDEHAPPGSALAVPIMEHTVRLVAPQRLRPDIRLLRLTSPLDPHVSAADWALLRQEAAAHPVFVMFVPRADWMNDIMGFLLKHRTPIKSWSLDGAPVLLIYRFDGS